VVCGRGNPEWWGGIRSERDGSPAGSPLELDPYLWRRGETDVPHTSHAGLEAAGLSSQLGHELLGLRLQLLLGRIDLSGPSPVGHFRHDRAPVTQPQPLSERDPLGVLPDLIGEHVVHVVAAPLLDRPKGELHLELMAEIGIDRLWLGHEAGR